MSTTPAGVAASDADPHSKYVPDVQRAIKLGYVVQLSSLSALTHIPSKMDITPVRFPGELGDIVGFTLSSSSVTNSRRAFAKTQKVTSIPPSFDTHALANSFTIVYTSKLDGNTEETEKHSAHLLFHQ